jgi:hypothetical protein
LLLNGWPTVRLLIIACLCTHFLDSHCLMHAQSSCVVPPNTIVSLYASKNLFIDNLPNMPRLKFLIVRIELCCLLGVKFLTAHKTWSAHQMHCIK